MPFTHQNFQKIATQYKIKQLSPPTESTQPISWIHYMEDPGYADWLKGKELILTTGAILGGETSALKKFIDTIFEKEASGLIINLSPYISEVPTEVIEYAKFIGFPLFEMPAECAIVEVSESVCRVLIELNMVHSRRESFLYNLIYENPKITNTITRRAITNGFSESSEYHCLLFQLSNKSIAQKETSENLIDHEDLLDFENFMMPYFPFHETEVMSVPLQEQLLVLLPITKETEDFLQNQLSEKIALYENRSDKKKNRKKNISICVGISSKWKDLINLRTNYKNAKLTLALAPFSKKGIQVLRYENMDNFFLMLSHYEKSKIEELYQPTLQPLMEYDRETNGNLINTLRTYIQHNAVLTDAAEALYIHLNTLRYRIHKIEQLLDCNLKDLDTLFSLHFELRVMVYLELINKTS